MERAWAGEQHCVSGADRRRATVELGCHQTCPSEVVFGKPLVLVPFGGGCFEWHLLIAITTQAAHTTVSIVFRQAGEVDAPAHD
jgi:hypothetical protein